MGPDGFYLEWGLTDRCAENRRVCFICSLDATGKLERELVLKSNENVWQAHIEREHNWRNYIFYLTYLLQKTGYAAALACHCS